MKGMAWKQFAGFWRAGRTPPYQAADRLPPGKGAFCSPLCSLLTGPALQTWVREHCCSCSAAAVVDGRESAACRAGPRDTQLATMPQAAERWVEGLHACQQTGCRQARRLIPTLQQPVDWRQATSPWQRLGCRVPCHPLQQQQVTPSLSAACQFVAAEETSSQAGVCHKSTNTCLLLAQNAMVATISPASNNASSQC